jgi:homeobox protein cut-like
MFFSNKEPTIKLLRDRIKELEEKNESQVASKLKERERDLQKSFAEKEEQFQSSQLDLVKKLGETEARLASMQSQLQKSQADLYELKSKQDELLNAKSLEIDMLMQDIDKLNERVASAERLSEQYAKKLAEREARETEVNDEKKAEIEQQQEKLIGYQTTALEIELAAKDKEISQLVDDVQKLQMKSNKMREFYEQQRIDLEDKLSARERSLEQLEYDLKKKLDYDEVRFLDQNLPDQNL